MDCQESLETPKEIIKQRVDTKVWRQLRSSDINVSQMHTGEEVTKALGVNDL